MDRNQPRLCCPYHADCKESWHNPAQVADWSGITGPETLPSYVAYNIRTHGRLQHGVYAKSKQPCPVLADKGEIQQPTLAHLAHLHLKQIEERKDVEAKRQIAKRLRVRCPAEGVPEEKPAKMPREQLEPEVPPDAWRSVPRTATKRGGSGSGLTGEKVSRLTTFETFWPPCSVRPYLQTLVFAICKHKLTDRSVLPDPIAAGQ
jgi:hypothetical protein